MIQCVVNYTFNICKESEVKLDNDHRYVHIPQLVGMSYEGNHIIKSPNNTLDIIIHDNEKRTSMLKDAAISGDRNVIKRDAEEILKYKDHTTGK
jgi:hypothetical protein